MAVVVAAAPDFLLRLDRLPDCASTSQQTTKVNSIKLVENTNRFIAFLASCES
jgi:hypothetical protein